MAGERTSLTVRKVEDFLFDRPLADLDPEAVPLIEFEDARQREKLQMIPSESICPKPVLAALATSFSNKYAEGYPSRRLCQKERHLLPDWPRYLAFHRRYGDRRYYKGTEYCDFVEALAQKRCAELFASAEVAASEIFVNVQPLSGAAANNAVYEALLRPGETVMGLHLSYGGHLTHGSPFNRSGRYYRVNAYTVDEKTGRLDYDAIRRQALEFKPRLLIAGASAYPWEIDWKRLRQICDEVGAYLLADIAHTAGLVVGGLFPNPVGHAHVTMFTTHKTMCGPRGAVLMSTDPKIARRIDAAVFPGEQGGPHMNTILAKAVSFQIARTEAFRRLMKRVVENCAALAKEFQQLGLPLAYGGTSTHMCLIDLRRVNEALTADVASNILDLCGITCNKNALPGDATGVRPSGLRFGTVVLSQRGMGPEEMRRIAHLIGRALRNMSAYRVRSLSGVISRAKMDFDLMLQIREEVAKLTADFPPFAAPQETEAHITRFVRKSELDGARGLCDGSTRGAFRIVGERARTFLNQACTADVLQLQPGQSTAALLLDADAKPIDTVSLWYEGPDEHGRDRFVLICSSERQRRVRLWLEALSDGYVVFDRRDLLAKIHGPVAIHDLTEMRPRTARRRVIVVRGKNPLELEIPKERFIETAMGETRLLVNRAAEDTYELLVPSHTALSVIDALIASGMKSAPAGEYLQPRTEARKPYFIGRRADSAAPDRQPFAWTPLKIPPRRTPLYEWHKSHGARMLEFGTYLMPGWYGRVLHEHKSVREAAGLFDVGHMGPLEISGPNAAEFLDLVTTNFVHALDPGQSQYSYLLDPAGRVLDDVIVYRLAADRFMMVVNAGNQDKVWDWLTGINEGRYLVDRDDPGKTLPRVTLLRLKERAAGERARIDLALQGPKALDILVELGGRDVAKLEKFTHVEQNLRGIPVLVSRTGYTGEEIGYELFVHPRDALKLWELLLAGGVARPCGLAARDSTRTEAGFPLYGHELAGKFDISPTEAGYGGFVKRHKPFFVGRQPLLEREARQTMTIVRFRITQTGARPVRPDDVVTTPDGQVIGWVTSCVVIDKEQIGMAYVRKDTSGRIGLYRPREEKGPPQLGDRVAVQIEAEVLPRFQLFSGQK